jgi:hypothetical protein
MRNLTVLMSDKMQTFLLCRHNFMANSPFVATGDRVAHPGSSVINYDRACNVKKHRVLPGGDEVSFHKHKYGITGRKCTVASGRSILTLLSLGGKRY